MKDRALSRYWTHPLTPGTDGVAIVGSRGSSSLVQGVIRAATNSDYCIVSGDTVRVIPQSSFIPYAPALGAKSG